MFLKAFQVVLVTCVVVFTAVMLVLVAYALLPILFHSTGIGAFSGGISAGVFDLGIALLLILTMVGVYLITGRKKLR